MKCYDLYDLYECFVALYVYVVISKNGSCAIA